MNIKLECTCSACPEQYFVLDESNNEIGYIRFRFGELEVHPFRDGKPDWDTHLLSRSVNDDYLGVIPDEFREEWLEESIQKIAKYYENNNN